MARPPGKRAGVAHRQGQSARALVAGNVSLRAPAGRQPQQIRAFAELDFVAKHENLARSWLGKLLPEPPRSNAPSLAMAAASGGRVGGGTSGVSRVGLGRPSRRALYRRGSQAVRVGADNETLRFSLVQTD